MRLSSIDSLVNRRSTTCSVVTTLVLLTAHAALAQSPQNSALVMGIPAVPEASETLGTRDSASVSELIAHLAAVGGPWQGMQGSGQITYGGDDSTVYKATLSNRGGDSFRLDAQSKYGDMSVRIHRTIGKIENGDGTFSVISPNNAMSTLFLFPLVRMDRLAGTATSLHDQGQTTIDGVLLHRISYSFGTIGRRLGTKALESSTIDFYFDPITHLLVKSATHSYVPDTRKVKFLFVVTYSDYRRVDGSLIPFRLSETMDGEPYWTLQLAEVKLDPKLAATYFEFQEAR